MLFDTIRTKGHENVLLCYDKETDLRAIIAVHDTTLGSALGGTRRWCYESEGAALTDVLRLSEAMTWKAAAADLPMGGAKSVIILDEPNEVASEEKARAMGRFVDRLNGVYIAAEDVGVDTQFIDWMAGETKFVMGGEKVSRGGDPAPYTARGVVNGIKGGLRAVGRPGSLEGVKIAVQGIGALGSNVVRIAKNEGADVVVAEINKSNLERVTDEFDVEVVGIDEIITSDCDVLCPCALGAVVHSGNISKLRCQVLCPGANNVLANPEKESALLHDRGIAYCPDFVANGGGLIRLAGLYVGWSEQQINDKIAQIEQTIVDILAQSEGNAHHAAVAYAKQRIDAGKLQTA
ncbi:MAG: Glu/Leu/Phe/Val family dehydrogenase [Planctomycetota bacterium]|jgi:leucine dehydrogenase